MSQKWNLREIMLKAWKIFRKGGMSFGEALHRAWNSAKAAPVNAQRIAEAKTAAGIVEDVNTWSGWKTAGFEVIHGSKALFGADLIYSSGGTAPFTRHGSLVVLKFSLPYESFLTCSPLACPFGPVGSQRSSRDSRRCEQGYKKPFLFCR